MRRRSKRAGEALRVVMVLAFILLGVPMFLGSLALLGWKTSAARAADQLQEARAAESRAIAQQTAERARQQVQAVDVSVAHEAANHARQDAEEARRKYQTEARGDGQHVRSVNETFWESQLVETQQPVRDPETGRIQYRKVESQRFVPRTVTSYQAGVMRSPMDPSVMRIISELQALEEQDPTYDRKLEELKTRLGLEFDSMHEAQAQEIARTEKRLEALKKLHQQRGENKEKIVQRRIDELLGRTDALRWEIGSRPIISTDSAAMLPYSRDPLAAPGSGLTNPTLPPGLPAPLTQDGFLPQPILPPGVISPVPPSFPPAPIAPAAPVPPAPAPTSSADSAPAIQWVEVDRQVFDSGFPSSEATNTPSTIAQLSDLARRASACELELRKTRRELESERRGLQTLRQRVDKQGGSPAEMALLSAKARDLVRLEDKFEQLQRESDLNQLEVETVKESLQRSVEFAIAQLETAQRGNDESRQRFEQGVINSDAVNKAEMELNRARKQLEEARTGLTYLVNSLRLLTPEAADEGEALPPLEEDSAELPADIQRETDRAVGGEGERSDTEAADNEGEAAALDAEYGDVEPGSS